MRESLKTKVGVRKIFTATFDRYGFTKNADGSIITAVLLQRVNFKGEPIVDHVWLQCPYGFSQSGEKFENGEKIMFTAEVTRYWKSGHEMDFGLTRPQKIKIINP